MRNAALIIILLATGVAGCGFADGESRHGALGHDDVIQQPETTEGSGASTDLVCEYPPILTGGGHAVDLRDCVKLEGGQLGQDLVLDVHGETVVVDEWSTKGDGGDYISFTVDGDVIVVVKAGVELFETSAGTWVYPGGTSGPDAHGISFVAFCEPATDEPVCTPSDCGEPGTSGGDGDGDGTTDGGDGGGSDGGDGGLCYVNGACDGGVCEAGRCQGGGESGVGESCTFNGDCAGSGVCVSGRCSSGGGTGGDGDACSVDTDCLGGDCESGSCQGNGSGGAGDSCTIDGDCLASSSCQSGTCGGAGSGGDTTDSGGTSGGDGSGGDTTNCSTTACDANTSCGDNYACVSGCCSQVVL